MSVVETGVLCFDQISLDRLHASCGLCCDTVEAFRLGSSLDTAYTSDGTLNGIAILTAQWVLTYHPSPRSRNLSQNAREQVEREGFVLNFALWLHLCACKFKSMRSIAVCADTLSHAPSQPRRSFCEYLATLSVRRRQHPGS